MTQLVIHTGMPMTSAAVIRDQLAGWREPLERAGVELVAKDAPKAWDRAVRQVLGGEVPPPLRRVMRRKQQGDAPTVLLSAELAARALGSRPTVNALRALSRDSGLTTKVVLVVREQLDLLNALYCRRVMALETSIGFESFVTDALVSGRLELDHHFAALQDASGVELVAVPYSRLEPHLPAAAVLEAAGAAGDAAVTGADAAADVQAAADDRWLPGPVLLTATRLLHKRLTRLGAVRKRPAEELGAAVAMLRHRATDAAWNEVPFWGWSQDLAATAEQHYRSGNDSFAARVWGAPWPDVAPSRPQTRQDLASEPPAVVSDVMTMIHRAVDELTAGRAVAVTT
ncbi:MAG: hypothetical protein ACR2JU_08625 [Nocardioidaceae bacterium]